MTRNRDRRGGAPRLKGEERRPAAPTKPARPAAASPEPRRERPREKREGDVARIYGFHSVEAALRAPRRELIRLYATAAAAERLKPEIEARGVETRVVSLEEISARAPRDGVHQGVLLEARPLAPIDLSELPPNGLVLVLDQITDPHNVGAILRTAAAFAVDALVTTERHSPEFSGALAKSASGGLEHVPVCFVTNLARALGEMGDSGYLARRPRLGGPRPARPTPALPPARPGPRRRGQGAPPPHQGKLRRPRPSRLARRGQEPQRFQRLRDRPGAYLATPAGGGMSGPRGGREATATNRGFSRR